MSWISSICTHRLFSIFLSGVLSAVEKKKLSYVKCQRKTLLMNKLNTFPVTANAIKFYQSNLGVLCHYINKFEKDRH